MRQYSAAALLAIIIAGLTASCGFHARGSLVSVSDVGSVFVDAEREVTITREVREALLDASFTLAENRDEASILLQLTDEVQDQNVVSVTSINRVSELELTHAIDLLIVMATDGEQATLDTESAPEPNRILVSTEYTFDDTNVLGKDNEARILREELKRDLVRQIMLRSIASLNPSVPL